MGPVESAGTLAVSLLVQLEMELTLEPKVQRVPAQQLAAGLQLK